jgi:hypothetical protein
MNMQTGFGDAGDRMAEQYIDTMTNLLLPVLEQSTLLAAEYSKACGRDTLLPEDMEYAMKYCAMYTVGQATGSMFPEIYQEGDDEEYESDEEMDIVSVEECPPFERYSGNDMTLLKMNEAYDRWNSWEPQNPTEHMLKNAINSNEHLRT